MYFISQPSGCSLEEHIQNLEYLYNEQINNNEIEAAVKTDVSNQINQLRKKLKRNTLSLPE